MKLHYISGLRQMSKTRRFRLFRKMKLPSDTTRRFRLFRKMKLPKDKTGRFRLFRKMKRGEGFCRVAASSASTHGPDPPTLPFLAVAVEALPTPSFSVYGSSKKYFATHSYFGASSDLMQNVYASLCGGACSTLTTNPIWVIKTRMMNQVSRSASDGARTPWHYNNTLDAARKMYKSEGLGAFYSGLAPALLGLTHVAIQFPLYEYLKLQFTGVRMGQAATEAEPGQNTLGILAATFFSKVCATSATYPHEVLRTRLQTQQRHAHPETAHDNIAAGHHTKGVNRAKAMGNTDGAAYQPRYRGILNTCRVILKEEGWKAFYNGMGTNMIRAIPAAMTTMLTFETVSSAVRKLQAEGRVLEASD